MNSMRSDIPEQSPLTEDEVMRLAFGHRNALLAYSYAILRDWSLAEDVVQEVYISLHSKVREMTFDDSPYRWLIKSVRLQSLYVRRSRQRVTCVEDEELLSAICDLFDENLSVHAAEGLARRKAALRNCMKELTDRALRVVVSFYHDSVSCEEMAKRTGHKSTAIRQLLSRARDQLRRCMTKRVESAEGLA